MLPDRQVRLVLLERRVLQGQQVPKVSLAQQEPQARLAKQDRPARQEQQDLVVHKAPLVKLASPEQLVLLE